MKPNASGDRIAASAEPVFMNPLAVPEYLRRDVHRDRPHRPDDDLGEEERAAEADDDDASDRASGKSAAGTRTSRGTPTHARCRRAFRRSPVRAQDRDR